MIKVSDTANAITGSASGVVIESLNPKVLIDMMALMIATDRWTLKVLRQCSQ